MVEQLLDHGVPADSAGERNPLSVAIVNNDYTSVRLLLLFGSDPNAIDGKDGFTPLLSATQASFYEAAELLLNYGADPNISAGPHDENAYARALNSGKKLMVSHQMRRLLININNLQVKPLLSSYISDTVRTVMLS